MSIQVGNKVSFAGVSSVNKAQKVNQTQILNKAVKDTVSFKSNDNQDPEQVRRNVELHNAKVRASGYAAIPLNGIFASIFYALKDPEKMAEEQRPDQKKEATFEQEVEKQKEIKRAQVKSSLVTCGVKFFTNLAFGIPVGYVTGFATFLAYKAGENPKKPWGI